MCLSYMTSVVRLGGSARTAKDHLLAGECAAGRRLTFAPTNFWICSATTSGWSMTMRWLASSTRLSHLKVQSSLLSALHMLSSKYGDFRFQFGARRDQPFRPDLR